MKHFFILILTVLFSVQAYSQTCSDRLEYIKKGHYLAKMNGDAVDAITVGVGFTGVIVGVSVASAAFPAFLIAASIATAPIAVGHAVKGIQNRPLNRMIRLIKQSEKLVANPDSKAGGLLKRVHKRLNHSKLNEISILGLATAISDANKDLTKCGTISQVKNIDDNVASGTLPVVNLDEEEVL